MPYAGFAELQVEHGGLMVNFTGPASAVERTFGTGLERYRLANGRTGHNTTGAIRLPAALAATISSVVGLDDLVRPQPFPVRSAPARTGPATPAKQFAHPAGAPDACPNAQATANEEGGLTDDQLARSYGAFGLYSSGDLEAGQHIAVFELQPFFRSDIRTFDTCFFGATAGPANGGTKVTINGRDLGCVSGVFFGTVPAKKIHNPTTFGHCGSTTQIVATAPAGTPGRTAKVTVTTIESEFTGTGRSKSAATYTYQP